MLDDPKLIAEDLRHRISERASECGRDSSWFRTGQSQILCPREPPMRFVIAVTSQARSVVTRTVGGYAPGDRRAPQPAR